MSEKLHALVTADLQRIKDHIAECKALGHDEDYALSTLSCLAPTDEEVCVYEIEPQDLTNAYCEYYETRNNGGYAGTTEKEMDMWAQGFRDALKAIGLDPKICGIEEGD